MVVKAADAPRTERRAIRMPMRRSAGDTSGTPLVALLAWGAVAEVVGSGGRVVVRLWVRVREVKLLEVEAGN